MLYIRGRRIVLLHRRDQLSVGILLYDVCPKVWHLKHKDPIHRHVTHKCFTVSHDLIQSVLFSAIWHHHYKYTVSSNTCVSHTSIYTKKQICKDKVFMTSQTHPLIWLPLITILQMFVTYSTNDASFNFCSSSTPPYSEILTTLSSITTSLFSQLSPP